MWSKDSSTVGFLIEGAHLELYDASLHRRKSSRWLIEWRREYPPSGVVKELSLSEDGRIASFRSCARRDDPKKPLAKDLWDGVTAPCSEVRQIDVTVGDAKTARLGI